MLKMKCKIYLAFLNYYFRRITLQRTSGSTRSGEVTLSIWHSKSAAGSLLLARQGLIPVLM